MVKSKKDNKNKKTIVKKKETTNKKNNFVLPLVVLMIVLCVVAFFIVKKRNISFENNETEVTTVETMLAYDVYVDENGNEVRISPDTKETTIIKKEELPTLAPEQQEKYESMASERQAEYDLVKAGLDEKFASGDMEEEEYYKLLDAAFEAKNTIDEEEVILHNNHVLKVKKEIFLACNQERFMQAMTLLFDDYHALVNLVDESFYDEKSPEVILYVSEFEDKDFDNIKARFVDAFNSEDFTFEKEK